MQILGLNPIQFIALGWLVKVITELTSDSRILGLCLCLSVFIFLNVILMYFSTFKLFFHSSSCWRTECLLLAHQNDSSSVVVRTSGNYKAERAHGSTRMMLLWMSCYLQQKHNIEFHSWSLNIIWVLNPVSCSLWGLNKSLLLPKANDIQAVISTPEMRMLPYSQLCQNLTSLFLSQEGGSLARILSWPLSLTLPLSEGYLTINTSSSKSDCMGPKDLEMEVLCF